MLFRSIPRELIVVIQALVILFTGALDNMVRWPLESLFTALRRHGADPARMGIDQTGGYCDARQETQIGRGFLRKALTEWQTFYFALPIFVEHLKVK